MRTVSVAWPDTIQRPHTMVTEVTSWRAGVQLGTTMRPESGTAIFDATAPIERRCELRFPAGDVGGVPADDPDHPLAAYGQRLNIRTGVVHPSGETELVDIGWYLITDWSWSKADDTVVVQGESLRRLVDDAQLWNPLAAASLNATLTYAVQWPALARAMLPTAQQLPITVSPALSTTAAVRPDRLYDVARGEELDKLAAEWGAQWRITDSGSIAVTPVPGALTSSTPAVAAARYGYATSGTVVDRLAAASRSRFANIVFVTGRAPDGGGAPATGSAFWPFLAGSGPSPVDWSGPMGQIVVHETNDSLLTGADATAWARQRVTQLVRPAVEIPLDVIPDPSWQLDDVIAVENPTLPVATGRLASMRLPLTAEEGPMSVVLMAGDYGLG